MKQTKFRKGGLAACMLLALLSGMPVGMISTPALAQQTPTLPQLNTGGIGQQVATAISSGQPTGSIANMITTAGGPNMTASGTDITTMINNFRTNGASPTAIAGLVNATIGNQLPPSVSTALSALQNLGNITNPAALQNLFTNPQIQQALNGLPGGLTGLTGAVQSIASIVQNPAALLNPGNLSAISNTIASAFPSLASAFGGASGIAAALGGVGGLLGGLTGGSGGSEPLSNQNPVNGSFTDAGCNCSVCNTQIPAHYGEVRSHTKAEFQRHRNWMVNNFWLENVLPALQLMAEQLTAVGIMQIQMIGAMLDAKHQLETQRLFQQMMAQAHKDYQPSEGMCTFGTTVRSLAGSERRSNLVQVGLAQRMTQRQALSGDVLSVEGLDSDKRSRLKFFIGNYCDQSDNANGLGSLCQTTVPNPARRNIDIDYTKNIESRLTLDVDFLPAPALPAGASAAATTAATTAAANGTADEQDVFSLAANLFSNNIAPKIEPELLAPRPGDGEQPRIRQSAVEKYMDLRAIFAKRSVAQNSFAAITAQRAAGAPESAPYTKAIIRELGVTDPAQIDQLIGTNPSYFAQMELLTKKIYQNPMFYTELYDKPANVERKGAAMQAIGLMQDRDLYNSLLRSEVVLSVLLETMLQKEQDKVVNEGPKRNPTGAQR